MGIPLTSCQWASYSPDARAPVPYKTIYIRHLIIFATCTSAMSTLHRVLSTNLCIPSRTTLIKWRDSPALRRSLKLYNPHCRGYQSAPMAPSLETGSKQLTSSLKPTSILHRTPWQPPVAKSAHGIYITLEDGKELIDAVGGAAVTCLGNSHPKVMQAIRDQLDKVSCTRFRFFF